MKYLCSALAVLFAIASTLAGQATDFTKQSDEIRFELIRDTIERGAPADELAAAITLATEPRSMSGYYNLNDLDLSVGGRGMADSLLRALQSLGESNTDNHGGALPSGVRPGMIFGDLDDEITYQATVDGLDKTALWLIDGAPWSGISRIVEAGDLTSGRYVVDARKDQIVFVSTGSTAAVIELPSIADAPSKRIWIVRAGTNSGVSVTVEPNSADVISFPLLGDDVIPLDLLYDNVIVNAAQPPVGTGGGDAGGWFVEQYLRRHVQAITTGGQTLSEYTKFATADTTSGGFTLTLCAAGQCVFDSQTVKNIGTGGNTLTLQLASATIDGSATLALADGESVTVAYNSDGNGVSF